ncbi:MAG: hypothetical protein RDU25_00195 [Patescibacteria group bacterium]|nr:hypothetical protein [Patescibacteria group bacterium]
MPWTSNSAQARKGAMMSIPAQVEFGNHVVHAKFHALPRVGDRIDLAFPASGVPRLLLRVTGVNFHQPCDFEGRDCPEPFAIVITTDDDPAFADKNAAVMKKAVGLDGGNASGPDQRGH